MALGCVRSRVGLDQPRHPFAQHLPPARQPLLHRILAQPKCVCDITHRLILAIKKHQRQTIVLRQRVEGVANHRRFLIAHRGLVWRRLVVEKFTRLVERLRATDAAQVAKGGIARNLGEPGPKFLRLAQTVDLAPRGDECLLSRVLARPKVAEHAERHAANHRLMPRDNLDERALVPALRGARQFGVGRGGGMCRTRSHCGSRSGMDHSP